MNWRGWWNRTWKPNVKFLVAIGLVLGFAYEFGMTWYATQAPQARDRPHFGLDVFILYGLIGAFWGCLLAVAVGAVYRKLRERHKINVAELIRQAEKAPAEDQGVWPPPPIDGTTNRGDPR